jgi:hypothetical protein
VSREASQGREGAAVGTGRLWSLVISCGLVPTVIAALMAYYLLVCRRTVGELGFPLDDSWIHVRFAQNLAHGYGFSFNPGQLTSSTTGPLWTLVLALGYGLTGEYLWTAAVLNGLFCWATALTAAALARTFVPNHAFGAAVALVVAVTVPLPWFALSGMEPPLYMWLTVLALLFHVRYRKTRGLKALLPTLLFGLAVYARPELLLLFPLALLDRLLIGSIEKRATPWAAAWVKYVALHAVVFGAIVAPFFAYNLAITGRPLPSSYYIKAMNFGIAWAVAIGSMELIVQSLVVAPIKAIFSMWWLWFANNFSLLVPFVFGSVAIIRQARHPETARHPSFLVPMLLLVQPVAWAISTGLHREPWFQGQRYVANLGPLYIVVGMVGAWWWLHERRPERLQRVLVGGLALVLLAGLVRQPDQARLFAHNVKNITEMQVATARWLRDHVPPDSLLAINDIGAVAVITDMRVFDVIGLVTREVLACRTLDPAGPSGYTRCVWEATRKANPDYLIVVGRSERFEGFVRQGHKPIFQIEIDDNITCSGPLIAVFEWYGLNKEMSEAPVAAKP